MVGFGIMWSDYWRNVGEMVDVMGVLGDNLG